MISCCCACRSCCCCAVDEGEKEESATARLHSINGIMTIVTRVDCEDLWRDRFMLIRIVKGGRTPRRRPGLPGSHRCPCGRADATAPVASWLRAAPAITARTHLLPQPQDCCCFLRII